jgi:hypothetical protein
MIEIGFTLRELDSYKINNERCYFNDVLSFLEVSNLDRNLDRILDGLKTDNVTDYLVKKFEIFRSPINRSCIFRVFLNKNDVEKYLKEFLSQVGVQVKYYVIEDKIKIKEGLTDCPHKKEIIKNFSKSQII